MDLSNYSNEQLIDFAKSYVPKGKTDLIPLIHLEANKRGIELSELEPIVSYGVGNSSLAKMTKVTEEQIYVNLKALDTKEVEDIADNYNYQWDENESTSRNLRELAEVMFNRES